jgi:hypothetical protein
MPICPVCSAEYRVGTTTCADCGAALVDRLVDDATTQDTVDVYRCWDEQELQRVIEVLRAAGVDTLLRDKTSSAFPMPGVDQGKIIAVTRDDAERARTIVEAAIQDGVIVGDGQVLAV